MKVGRGCPDSTPFFTHTHSTHNLRWPLPTTRALLRTSPRALTTAPGSSLNPSGIALPLDAAGFAVPVTGPLATVECCASGKQTHTIDRQPSYSSPQLDSELTQVPTGHAVALAADELEHRRVIVACRLELLGHLLARRHGERVGTLGNSACGAYTRTSM